MVNIASMKYDQQLAVYALEGLANRTRPTLMVDTSSLFWSWPPADKHLESRLTSLGYKLHPLASLEEAVTALKSRIAGVVVYNPRVDAERYAACTLAGIRSGLPVSTTMMQGSLAKLPVLARFDTRWHSNALVYSWAIDHLMPQCSHSICYSAGVSYPGCNVGGDKSVTVGLDYGFYRRAFMFNLSPNETSGYGFPAYPTQAAMFKTILHKLPELTEVFGWAEPEPQYCKLISQCGDSIVCSAAPNLSLYASLGKALPKLALLLPRKVNGPIEKLKPRYYVDFETNEADTPKIAASWQMGAWFSNYRGKVPITWGLTATLAQDAPALYAAYVNTQTADDSFFSGVSGGGYCLLNLLPNLQQYAIHTRSLLRQTHERVADVWESPGVFMPDLLQDYVKLSGVKGISHYPVAGKVGVYYLADGSPVILPAQSLFYYSTTSPAQLAELIFAVARQLPRPGFIECYGGLSAGAPQLYYETMRLLGSKFEAVSLSSMVRLARKASGLTISKCPVFVQSGQSSKVSVTVRNFLNAPHPFALKVTTPQGWIAKPLSSISSTLQPFQVMRVNFLLTATSNPSSGNLTVEDVSRDLTSQRHLLAATPYWQINTADPSPWRAWKSNPAVIAADKSGLLLSCPAALPYAAAEITLPFQPSEGDLLQLNVSSGAGEWSVKIVPPGGSTDIMLIPDNAAHGTFYANLPSSAYNRRAGPWQLRLFAIGEGSHISVSSLQVLRVKKNTAAAAS